MYNSCIIEIQLAKINGSAGNCYHDKIKEVRILQLVAKYYFPSLRVRLGFGLVLGAILPPVLK